MKVTHSNISSSLPYRWFAYFTLQFLHKRDWCFLYPSTERLCGHAGVVDITLCTSSWLIRQPTWVFFKDIWDIR